MRIVTTAITLTELAAIRAVLETDLRQFGPMLEIDKPELYQALMSVKDKLATLAQSREITVSA